MPKKNSFKKPVWELQSTYFGNSLFSLRNFCLLLLVFIVRLVFIVIGSVEGRQKMSSVSLYFQSKSNRISSAQGQVM